MPSKSTVILIPIPTTDSRRSTLRTIYNRMWKSLEKNDFENIDVFLNAHNITSYDRYTQILQSGITRPMVFIKREPHEKWINPFNPFILNLLGANMDFQFILDEFSCASYVVEYVNKSNRGISNLQQNILKTMDEHPEFDVLEVTRQLGINMLNSVELTSQEAAWYLLRQPMSQSTVKIIYIPTSWPIHRERIRKTNAELAIDNIDNDSCDIWKENVFDKYQQRPSELDNVTLAQFAAYYTFSKGEWKKRNDPRVIRYRNFNVQNETNEYKREMVTLHLTFRDEENDVLAEHKYIQLYNINDVLITERRKEFESSLDISQTLEICRNLCVENDVENQAEEDGNVLGARALQTDAYGIIVRDPNADINADIRSATLNRLGCIVRKRDNIMARENFIALMRQANTQQKALLLHVIDHIIDSNSEKEAIQIFLTGPAGCGKTFVIHLLKEIYNRFTNVQMPFNSYLTCASTGKAAVAIDGTTIHTAFKLSLSRNSTLSFEVIQQFRSFFKFISSIIIDEISMVSAELNEKVDARLKQITGNNITYGGKDMYLIGDLRQLPPVRSTSIYKQTRNSIAGPSLWRSIKLYELTEIMRQTNTDFSNLLTKVGNGEILNEAEQNLIESRFFTKEEADELCISGVRLFFKNEDVIKYNQSLLNMATDKIESIATDTFSGHHSAEQLAFCRQKLHKMSILETSGLPYELLLVIDKPYLITTNIDVSDGLANGAIGILKFIEYANPSINNDGAQHDSRIIRLWIKFPDSARIGTKIKRKTAHHATTLNIDPDLVPIGRRNCLTYLNNNRSISVKRNHFPLVSACGMTIHKSQGATFNQIVYYYDRRHDQQLVYVALSRVTTLEGLFIVAPQNEKVFHHGRRPIKNLTVLQQEFDRMRNSKLETIQDVTLKFLRKPGVTTFMTFNCQSLAAHSIDLQDPVTRSCDILLLTETWMANDTTIFIPMFQCCSQYKRSEQRSGGVAIYKKCDSNSNTPTSHNSATIQTTLTIGDDVVGDICCNEFVLTSGLVVHFIAVYISPGQTIQNIIKFLQNVLLPYAEPDARQLGNNLHQMPIIMGGDFNTNFSKPESTGLIKFLYDNFKFNMSNHPSIPTTINSTTIDVVFSRYLNFIESKIYISYFSYHKPILTICS